MSDEDKTTGPEQSGPEEPKVPATQDPEVKTVGTRTGMFGARGTGDTSGFGGLEIGRASCRERVFAVV